jgi:hypothetical protein
MLRLIASSSGILRPRTSTSMSSSPIRGAGSMVVGNTIAAAPVRGIFVGYVSFDTRSGLAKVTFKDGRVTSLESLRGAESEVRSRQSASGAKDKPGEFVIGTNPALTPVLKSGYMPYYGYAAGIVRLSIGDNWESGGRNR